MTDLYDDVPWEVGDKNQCHRKEFYTVAKLLSAKSSHLLWTNKTYEVYFPNELQNVLL